MLILSGSKPGHTEQIGRESLGKFHVITTGGKLRGDSHFHLKFLCIVSFFFSRGGFFWPCSLSVALCGLSLVVVSRGCSSLWRLLLLRITGLRVLGSAVVAPRL